MMLIILRSVFLISLVPVAVGLCQLGYYTLKKMYYTNVLNKLKRGEYNEVERNPQG